MRKLSKWFLRENTKNSMLTKKSIKITNQSIMLTPVFLKKSLETFFTKSDFGHLFLVHFSKKYF